MTLGGSTLVTLYCQARLQSHQEQEQDQEGIHCDPLVSVVRVEIHAGGEGSSEKVRR